MVKIFWPFLLPSFIKCKCLMHSWANNSEHLIDKIVVYWYLMLVSHFCSTVVLRSLAAPYAAQSLSPVTVCLSQSYISIQQQLVPVDLVGKPSLNWARYHCSYLKTAIWRMYLSRKNILNAYFMQQIIRSSEMCIVVIAVTFRTILHQVKFTGQFSTFLHWHWP